MRSGRTSRLKRAALGVALPGCLLLLAGGSASAATTIGQTGNSSGVSCGISGSTDTWHVQRGTGQPPSYVAPSAGVITSWSTLASAATGQQMQLKVFRQTGPTLFFVVGESAIEPLAVSTLNTFPTRIAVQAGDMLGLSTPLHANGGACVFTSNDAGDSEDTGHGPSPPGSTVDSTPNGSNVFAAVGSRLNETATVEPDADGDGFGDETQDKCQGAPGPLQGCPKADLAISKTASAPSVVLGGNVTYTLTAKNNGPDAAPGVAVSDALPAGATLVSASSTAGPCDATVKCSLGTLANGGSATITIVAKATQAGTVTNTATIDSPVLDQAAGNVSGAGDTNAANNTASTTTTVIAPLIAASVSNPSQSNGTWREPGNPKLATISRRRPPVGTTFKFSLDKAAAVRFDFTQPVQGRKVNGKCVAKTNRNKRKHKCTRTAIRGTLSFAGHAGVNTVKFQGRISASKKLKPGKYTLVITATTPGVGSTSKKLTFTIVR